MSANMSNIGKVPIQSTAGAIPVRTEKGMAMEKVKVTRYVAGKRPEYAASDSSATSADSDSESEDVKKHHVTYRRKNQEKSIDRSYQASIDAAVVNDKRMRRLMKSKGSRDDELEDEDEKYSRHREIHEPEIVSSTKSRAQEKADSYSEDSENEKPDIRYPDVGSRRRRAAESSDEVEEDDLSDDELERRRAMIKARSKSTMNEKEEELLGKVEESGDESDVDEESEYEEETDSEEDAVQRLKPVFVRKRDRVTLQDTEKEQQKLREIEVQRKQATEERKRQSTKMVEDLVRLDVDLERKKMEDDHIDLTSVNTDDENEELAYEAWKLRELKRVKRDKEEREAHEKDKTEIERIHNMSEEERRAFLRANPKLVTNKQQKGKYKFLQKYYHRGVFFLNDEDDVLKRNFAEPTLEDHFDKSILPKVMQVKDFGKAGRTKWTHLVQEDTTDFQSAWVADTAQNLKFFQKHGAGIKDVFERPATKKRKTK